MSRWTIERSGTGIERSGTGIEKSGTGIEKSGTGIEKSGTGIEKSGTGIRRGLLVFALATITCAGSIQAAPVDPAGSLQVVVQNDSIAVSWIIGDSVFSGVSSRNGSFASLMLTEVSLSAPINQVDVTGGGTGSNIEVTGGGTGAKVQVTGGGTGSKTQVTGGGTGAKTQVTGGGTGSSIQVTGGGTGSSVQVTGGGTGISTQVTGGGTGSSIDVTGGGTGSSIDVTGGGTGSSILVTGGGTGSEAIAITLPGGTGMSMEVMLGCQTAIVSIVDENSVPIATFDNVRVLGSTGLCNNSRSRGSRKGIMNPNIDFD